jgi:UDP-glucuronate decarboxylase
LNILITGGYGFLGKHVAERFIKDGHKVIIIDSGSGISQYKIESGHKLFDLDVNDPACIKIFESRNIDIVIHLAGIKMKAYSGNHKRTEDDANLTGLANMLTLSEKYDIKKFIIVSCSSIYGNPGSLRELPFREDDKPEPVNPAGMNNYIKEYYTKKWSELYSLDTLCIRTGNIYGPGEKPDGGVIPAFIDNILNSRKLLVSGYGTQTRDFLYVEDFADALLRAALDNKYTGILNISSNKRHSINVLTKTLSRLFEVKKIEHLNDRRISINHSMLDNTRIKRTGWQPENSLEEGLKKTFAWHREQFEQGKKLRKPVLRFRNALKNFPRQVLAYIENVLAFLVVAFLQYNNLFLELFSSELVFDYSLIYIAIMGILWGQKQAYLAMLLSSALFIGTSLLSGTDIVSFIYTPENLLKLAAYVLIGVITGYSIEKRNRDLESREYALKSLNKKYDFLNEVYDETRVVKDELQNQIIETEDSFGVIYGIVQEVDSLEIEKVFAASIDAIEKIMKTDSVSIYTVNSNEKTKFMRLKTRSNSLNGHVPNSIDLDKNPDYKEVITSRSIVVNHDLKEDVPMLTAPVIDGSKVIAVVSLHEIPFENLTMHYENLFQTVVSLISNALKRAYFFEASLKDKRYVNNTRILNPDTFEKILGEVREKDAELGMSYSLLRISRAPNKRLIDLSDAIIKSIRDNDYIGISEKKKIYILLSNTAHSHANIVIDRLSSQGIESSIVSRRDNDI